MVSNQRSSSDPGQPGSRDPGFHSLVENSFESPQRNPTRIPSDRSLPLHRLKCCGLGCSHGQKDRLRKVVRGHEKELHINVLELNAIWLGLQAFEDILQDSNVAIMCDNVSAIAYLRNQGGTRSQQMCRYNGHRYLQMGRKTVHDTDTQTSPWASRCVSRSSEPQRSVSENRMDSESSCT